MINMCLFSAVLFGLTYWQERGFRVPNLGACNRGGCLGGGAWWLRGGTGRSVMGQKHDSDYAYTDYDLDGSAVGSLIIRLWFLTVLINPTQILILDLTWSRMVSYNTIPILMLMMLVPWPTGSYQVALGPAQNSFDSGYLPFPYNGDGACFNHVTSA